MEYDAEKPEDLVFEVYMGEGDFVASDLAVIVDQTLLDFFSG